MMRAYSGTLGNCLVPRHYVTSVHNALSWPNDSELSMIRCGATTGGSVSDMYNTLQHHLEEPEIACIMYWSLAGLDYLHKSHKVNGAGSLKTISFISTNAIALDSRLVEFEDRSRSQLLFRHLGPRFVHGMKSRAPLSTPLGTPSNLRTPERSIGISRVEIFFSTTREKSSWLTSACLLSSRRPSRSGNPSSGHRTGSHQRSSPSK